MGIAYLDMIEEKLKEKLKRATLVTRQGLNEALEIVEEFNRREVEELNKRFRETTHEDIQEMLDAGEKMMEDMNK